MYSEAAFSGLDRGELVLGDIGGDRRMLSMMHQGPNMYTHVYMSIHRSTLCVYVY